MVTNFQNAFTRRSECARATTGRHYVSQQATKPIGIDTSRQTNVIAIIHSRPTYFLKFKTRCAYLLRMSRLSVLYHFLANAKSSSIYPKAARDIRSASAIQFSINVRGVCIAVQGCLGAGTSDSCGRGSRSHVSFSQQRAGTQPGIM